jgi:hypothetical protein
MTPAEKAKQLVQRFYFSLPNNGGFTGPCNINDRWEEGKKCALIAVDEILNALSYKASSNFEELKYYTEVKQEIEKI